MKLGAAGAALGTSTSYLIREGEANDPYDLLPQLSRRARRVPEWAALRQLGRSGVTSLMDGLVLNARALATGPLDLPDVTVFNDVIFTQVSLYFGSDERTRAVTAAPIADRAVWMSGSKWQGHNILQISVSNWSTNAADVAFSIETVKRALQGAK